MKDLPQKILLILLLALNFTGASATKFNVKLFRRDSIPTLVQSDFSPSVGTYLNTDTAKTDSILTDIPKRYHYILFAPADSIHLDNLVVVDELTFNHRIDSIMRSQPLSRSEYLLYNTNPLFLPLVFTGSDFNEPAESYEDFWKRQTEKQTVRLFSPSQPRLFFPNDMITNNLRNETRKYIANHSADLYVTSVDRLPALSTFMSRTIDTKKLNTLHIYDDKIKLNSDKIALEKVKLMYWRKTARALLQFSQNYISSNWHQGGNSNLAFLHIFSGEMNYNNFKNIQWENKLEWRLGINSVDGDTLRKFSVNDDVLRYLTKFGVKAGGNWYYSISGDFSTQLFDNYKRINSNEYKARLFTPVRANVGIGMDYKYKKIFSLMIAPITLKYIYVNDTVNVNPNLFGIPKGKNQIKQLGSSLLAQLNFSPMRNWSIDSKLTLFSDYKKITIDWETVNNFTINRFLTTRLSLNPRYDNAVIFQKGEKARIQFKELLSIGFSYRFI